MRCKNRLIYRPTAFIFLEDGIFRSELGKYNKQCCEHTITGANFW